MTAEIWNPEKYGEKHEGWDDNIEGVGTVMMLMGTIIEKNTATITEEEKKERDEKNKSGTLEVKKILNKIEGQVAIEEVINYLDKLNDEGEYNSIQSIIIAIKTIIKRAETIIKPETVMISNSRSTRVH